MKKVFVCLLSCFQFLGEKGMQLKDEEMFHKSLSVHIKVKYNNRHTNSKLKKLGRWPVYKWMK